MDFVISPAQPKHANVLTEITVAAKRHWNYPQRWIELWIPVLKITSEYIMSHETWTVFIDNEAAAYYSFAKNDEGLWLDNLWVLPKFIGQGIGASLFRHAIERARERGASILKIEADPHAQGFYERMGARKVSEHHGSMDGQPRILPVMEINL